MHFTYPSYTASLLIVGLGLTFSPNAGAGGAPGQDYDYTITNHAVTITKYIGPGGDVRIPERIRGLPVTSIGDFAFYYSYGVTRVILPHGVRSIGDGAFYECHSLTDVVIPHGVTSIGDSAFCGCFSLTEIDIPDSVSDIGDNAFADCFSLTHVIIPSSITDIGVGTFAVCTNLITVVIPDSVTSIEDLAFYACPNLRTIYFMGNAPSLNAPILGDSWIFHYDSNATAYYLQGTTGWAEFSSETGLPTVMITKPGRHKHHEEHKYFR